jgi:hypothetical protein
MAIEFLPQSLRQLTIASTGLVSKRKPLRLAGVGWVTNAELQLPATIGLFVVYSNPIMVAGFNSFMLFIEVAVDGVDLSVAHCDPRSLQTLQSNGFGSVAPATPTMVPFGAFEVTVPADTSAMDWYVIRIGLASIGVEATLVNVALFAGMR